MKILRKYIKEVLIESVFVESINQADKIYFKAGLLTPEDREVILGITGGDNYTRLVADWAYHLTKVWKSDLNEASTIKFLNDFYKNIVEYNKNVFPVDGDLFQYSAHESDRGRHILDLFAMLKEREFVIKELRKLPSIAIDNLKKFIREPRANEYYFKKIAEKLRNLNSDLKMLPGPGRWDDEETIQRKQIRKDSLLKKIFASTNTFDQMVNTAAQFAKGFNAAAEETGKEGIIDNLQYIEADLVQDSGDILVVRANDQEAMQQLGCTSMWCFARQGAEGDWNSYASLGYAYIIYDFSKDFEEATFMMTYLPDSGALYTSTNFPVSEVGIDDEDSYLISIGVDMNKIYSYEPKLANRERELAEIRKIIRKQLLEESRKSKAKSKFKKLEDNKVPLTDEERKKVMDADAVWHHGLNGAPSPAVWKSVNKDGEVTFVTNTHRAYQDRPTLNGAISIYHSFIKGTS